MKCTRCRERPAVSVAIGKCEVCLYEEEFGQTKTSEQVLAAEKERNRRKKVRRR